jgi:hypothetical protein
MCSRCTSLVVVLEHVSDRVFDAVRGVSDGVAHARRDRVREQDRGDSHGGDRQRQARASTLSVWSGGPRGERRDRHARQQR